MLLSASEIRIGIVVARNNNRRVMDVAGTACSLLLRGGCITDNLQIKYVPSDADIMLGVMFFAEYTDVDAVIAIADRYDQPTASALLDLQMQWNMPIEYRYEGSMSGDGCNVVELVQMQNDMAAETPEDKTPITRRESIN